MNRIVVCHGDYAERSLQRQIWPLTHEALLACNRKHGLWICARYGQQGTGCAARLFAALFPACNVRTDTPMSTANWDWERPVFFRASITGDVTSLTWPAYISRTDCKSSVARSRLASWAANSDLERGFYLLDSDNHGRSIIVRPYCSLTTGRKGAILLAI